MKPGLAFYFYALTFVMMASVHAYGQDPPPYRRTAISINVTRSLVSEVNMSFERFISSRKSIEFNGGIIYVNEFLEQTAKDWNNSTLFSEHGFGARVHYKVFRRPEPDTKWRDYIAPGIVFKNLYYNVQWFEVESSEDSLQRIYQERDRKKFGVEFLWGKVYEMSAGFALEFYYGAGIIATMADRAIYIKEFRKTTQVFDPPAVAESFYLRPTIQVGMKIRFRM